MPSYKVRISLEGDRVELFKKHDFKLCMAMAINDSEVKDTFSVIAFTANPERTLDVTWTAEYEIGATDKPIEQGDIIPSPRTPRGIQPGYTYDMQSWSDVSVVHEPDEVPDGCIGFSSNVMCSPVLSLKIQGKTVPVYVSRSGLHPGKEMLKPEPTVAFWWQQAAEASTMITRFKDRPHYTSPSPDTLKELIYDESGSWKEV